MTVRWFTPTPRLRTWRADMGKVLSMWVSPGRKLEDGTTEYSIFTFSLTTVKAFSDDEEAKAYAEKLARQILAEGMARLGPVAGNRSRP